MLFVVRVVHVCVIICLLVVNSNCNLLSQDTILVKMVVHLESMKEVLVDQLNGRLLGSTVVVTQQYMYFVFLKIIMNCIIFCNFM